MNMGKKIVSLALAILLITGFLLPFGVIAIEPSISASDITIANANVGYAAHTPQFLVITNDHMQDNITISETPTVPTEWVVELIDGVSFTISPQQSAAIFTVRPATGLAAGNRGGILEIGYTNDETQETGTLNINLNFTVVAVDAPPTGRLLITQRIAGTNQFHSGVQYEVRRVSDDHRMGFIITNQHGEAAIDLPSGEYYARMVSISSRFELNQQRLNFSITTGMMTYLNLTSFPRETSGNVHQDEYLNFGGLNVHVTCAVTREPLIGVLYEIRRTDVNQFMGHIQTDRNGRASMHLPVGVYQLRELRHADGFFPRFITEPFVINQWQTTTIQHQNIPDTQHIITTLPALQPEVTPPPTSTPPPEQTGQGQMPFTDVPLDAWFRRYVEDVWNRQIMSGTSATRFDPNMPLTRAQAVQIMANYMGVNPHSWRWFTFFEDVPFDAWYAPAVNWARTTGIVSGVSAYHFNPHGAVTRQELAAMLNRLASQSPTNILPVMGIQTQLNDLQEASGWAQDSVEFVVRQEILPPRASFFFEPTAQATRAEMAMAISRIASRAR